jgi:hypothetical protein
MQLKKKLNIQKSTKPIKTNYIYLENSFGWIADICGYSSIGLDRAGVPLSIMTRLALFSKSPAACVRADLDDFKKWDSSCEGSLNKSVKIIFKSAAMYTQNYDKQGRNGILWSTNEKDTKRLANITPTTYYMSVHKHVYLVHYVCTVCTEQISSSSNAAHLYLAN